MQQILVSQREKKVEIKGDMDGLKEKLKGYMDGLKVDMEGLKEGLTKLQQERLPSGDKVIRENQDEEIKNMNYYFRESNVGFKNYHIPKLDMSESDDKDPVTWILEIEQYFDCHNGKHT